MNDPALTAAQRAALRHLADARLNATIALLTLAGWEVDALAETATHPDGRTCAREAFGYHARMDFARLASRDDALRRDLGDLFRGLDGSTVRATGWPRTAMDAVTLPNGDVASIGDAARAARAMVASWDGENLSAVPFP